MKILALTRYEVRMTDLAGHKRSLTCAPTKRQKHNYESEGK
jgi:hypothetical protein